MLKGKIADLDWSEELWCRHYLAGEGFPENYRDCGSCVYRGWLAVYLYLGSSGS
jgi:hypothetical protein